MNPWDLSCRSKLPHGDLDELELKSDAVDVFASIVTSAYPAIAASSTSNSTTVTTVTNKTTPQLYSNLSHKSSSSSSSASSPLPSSTTSPSRRSPPSSLVSSRSNSIEGCDDTQLDKILLAQTARTLDIMQDQVGQADSTDPIDIKQQAGSLFDRKARKKDQNRRAAYNYRRKKMEEKNRMREEEMRLVYSRVCLSGYADELENSIMYMLNTKTKRILDKDGNAICFICPVCLQPCDNISDLRSHLNALHVPTAGGR